MKNLNIVDKSQKNIKIKTDSIKILNSSMTHKWNEQLKCFPTKKISGSNNSTGKFYQSFKEQIMPILHKQKS